MNQAGRLLGRGLLLRCPYCGRPTLVAGLLAVHDRCQICGLVFEHGEGFFLGALIINYSATALVGIIPAIVAVAVGAIGVPLAIGYAAVVSVLFPILFYWHAKSLWMACYYLFVPDDLRPRRGGPIARPVDLRGLTPEQRQQLDIEEALAELEGGSRLDS